MKKMTGDQVRQAFLDFFATKDHMIEPGASLVPINDPTLLWINSGVAALKKYFDGTVKPQNNRIANAQKSIRTNDIENVGKTARHQTFFEMLGNFSIGDYFKEEAIAYGWEFMTSPQWMGFDAAKLYISVHPDDQEAYDIWVNKIGVDPKKILKSADNFWQIGDGPCGPNSEIYYDRGEKYDPQGLGERLYFEELENDRYVEIWNIVFSQYDGKEGVDRKLYKELPHKNIDTGMGLERLVCVVQECDTNFDTDLLFPLIQATEKFSTIKYGQSQDMAYRVIADHIRTVTFALADGALFSNEGRGYVLRRVLRRAVRYGKYLCIENAFMYNLVSVTAEMMKAYYPYLSDKVEFIAKMVKAEEERFHLTLADGENLLRDLLDNSPDKLLPGNEVFKLYDTYGFPLELTLEIAAEKGYQVDVDGFKEKMEQQKQRARDSRENVESMTSQSADLMDFTTASEFIGYENLSCEAEVIALFKNGVKQQQLTDEGDVVFTKTVFYAESGGQIADSGSISGPGFQALVLDVKKAPHKQHLIHIKIEEGSLKVGDRLRQQVESKKRLLITRHHSSGHLLQYALKEVLGDHINQAGSFITPEYLRFDFTHFAKVSTEELDKIEKIVNELIERSATVNIEYLPLAKAKEIGATALFDEKYGEIVRVVGMGDFSLELCGGCHVNNTAEIGSFKIISEESIGSGIRRVTACVNIMAYYEFKKEENYLREVADLLKAPTTKQIKEKIGSLQHELEELRSDHTKLSQKLLEYQAEQTVSEAVDNGFCPVLLKQVDETISDLKAYAEKVNRRLKGIVFVYQIIDKVIIACACSPEAITAGFKAGNLVKEAALICGGNGGGKDDIAQAGGKETVKVDEMLTAVKEKLKL